MNETEESLRKENIVLRSQYDILEGRVEASMKVLEKIRGRDDNYYRVLMQMDPMSLSRRFAGYDYENNYANLKKLSDNELLAQLTQSVDLMEHQIYSQIQSFDQLLESAAQKHNKISHIPASFPLPKDSYSIAGGYGLRRDPVSGQQKFHTGIDFAAKEGTPVYATADGTIKLADHVLRQGNMIEINHGYNYISRYSHLSEIKVKEGEKVKRGDLIGLVGSSGISTNNHLHYEVRFKNEPQNPVNYFYLDLTPEMYAEICQQSDDAGNVMD